jgi:hypothetical protein
MFYLEILLLKHFYFASHDSTVVSMFVLSLTVSHKVCQRIVTQATRLFEWQHCEVI